MNIYSDYFDVIKEVAMADKQGLFEQGLSAEHSVQRSRRTFSSINDKIRKMEPAPSLRQYYNAKGLAGSDYEQKLGLHPDFGHLKTTDKTEEHYIVSCFVDIAGSTNMFKKFSKEAVFLIINTLVKANIHTVLLNGGYVQRIQGDGLFIYFGGKRITKETAVKNALLSLSMYSYFVENELKQFLSSFGIEKISIRSGVDLGDDHEVLWGSCGIDDISEITTCSLHTSLASKMQNSAHSCGIVAGANIKEAISGSEEYFTVVSSRTKDENDRYIFRDSDKGFYYTQYDFNWEKFLKSQPGTFLDQYGKVGFRVNENTNRDIENLRPIAELSKPYLKR